MAPVGRSHPPSRSSSGLADSGSPTTSNREIRSAARDQFRVSRFDIVTSFFGALILFIGTFVTLLFVIWLTNRWTFPPRAIAPTIEPAAGRGDRAEGFERDFEAPGEEEIEDLRDPTLEESIEAVTDAVSMVAASLTTADTDSLLSTTGSASGDSRPPGPEGEGVNVVPRYDRWQLDFSALDRDGYATQLDFYGIELGAIGGNIQGVDVARRLSAAPQVRRILDTANESRLYFMWTFASPLVQFDRQLLDQAGVSLAGGRKLLKFIPKDLEEQLAQTELDYAVKAGHPSVVEIAKTVFESKPVGDGYRFEVTAQRYRKP